MFSLLCAVVFALGATTLVAADRLAITPHDSYSSSIGVLGCKINTDRVAYWPMAVDCDDICVRVSHGGRSVDLLRIDQSTGAYDISYDAWNYLVTGRGAAEGAATGGPVEMEVQRIPADNCLRHIRTGNGGLPLSAPNSINFLAACLARPRQLGRPPPPPLQHPGPRLPLGPRRGLPPRPRRQQPALLPAPARLLGRAPARHRLQP